MKDSGELREETALYIEYVYRKYSKMMFRIASRFAGANRMEQEDIVSISLLALMKNTETLRNLLPEAQQSYVAQAAITSSLSYLRNKRAIRGREISLDTVPDPAIQDELADHVMLHEELQTVIQIIMQLPGQERKCIEMKYLYGKKDAEIASVTGLSVNSIPTYIHRARERLRVMYAHTMEDNDE